MTIDAIEPAGAPDPYVFVDRRDCPACGADAGRVAEIYSAPFSKGGIGRFVREYYGVDPDLLKRAPYALVRCRDCTLLFQRYVGAPALLADLYTHWVDEPDDPALLPEYNRELGAIPQSRDAHEIMAASALLGIPVSGLQTLDYGMGWALWARIAAALGCASYGSDLARPRMDYAARHGVRTLEDAEIDDHRFHFINTEQVFEHVPDPAALAARLAGSLRPDGVLKISVPSGERSGAVVETVRNGAYAGDYQTIVPIQPLEHVNTFTHKAVRQMAENAGLTPVRPSLIQRYAFLRHRGTLGINRPKKMVKELIRPIYQYRNPANIYAWFRRPA